MLDDVRMNKVSVLVPVYNVERYIERCARSLFEQTYHELEFVFVNDCTPDRSVEVLKQVMEEYPERKSAVKIVNHEKNRGVAAARNTALDNASGEFLSWVDGDDWIEKNAIELLVQQQSETDADIVTGSFYEHIGEKIVEWRVKGTLPLEKEQRVLMVMDAKYGGYQLWCRLIRRSLYEQNRIRCIEGCNMAEDVRQIISLSYFAEKLSVIDDFIYHYDKLNPDSVMHNNQKPEKVVKNCYEHLQNVISIRDFFADKENVYYEKAMNLITEPLRIVIKMAVKYKEKELFHSLVRWVDDHEDCMRAMGWQKDGIKGLVLHNYWCMRIKWQGNRLEKLLKRKLNLN